MIQARTLRGFADVLPEMALLRRRLLRTIEDGFEASGFYPIVTPALEYAEVLRGKGGDESDRQIYEFSDQGGRQVAMRFDLTVPLARFVAQHQNDLSFPLRAYQIGTVWRGERPQRGRYRELTQCDIDIVGSSATAADAEVIVTVATTLARLPIGDFTVRLNDRRLLAAVFAAYGIEEHDLVRYLRIIDKLEKIGADAVVAQMEEAGLRSTVAQSVVASVSIPDAPAADTLALLRDHHRRNAAVLHVLAQLETLVSLASAAGIAPARVVVDPSIARGLDYYTSTVFETRLVSDPGLGSIASGGRYDNLTGVFTASALPGVGGSIGISRILGVLDASAAENLPLTLIVTEPGARQEVAFELAADLRNVGAHVAVHPEALARPKHAKAARRARAAVLIVVQGGDEIRVSTGSSAGMATRCHRSEVAKKVLALTSTKGTSRIPTPSAAPAVSDIATETNAPARDASS